MIDFALGVLGGLFVFLFLVLILIVIPAFFDGLFKGF